ncbi:hypothetical protein QBC43DRAFT_327208 [Cladorrhinum sp. PSN259]|nr:hypothetical protein QBC43DRAFT_327208 [Cladorrhinum sp. PSN259]
MDTPMFGDPDLIRSDEESAVETDEPSNPPSESSEDDATSEESDAEPRIPNEEGLSDQDRDQTVHILRDLRHIMEINQRDFVFACGGSLPITTSFTLRWDPLDDSRPASHCKLVINPEATDHNSYQERAVDALVTDMLPAKFGLGGEDVYDEEYRRALQLDPSKFSTNFCPYTSGIIDTITQVLDPALGRDQTLSSVRAELYKLNVYQGPSGHFRAHVDTPRSPSQFGSLVVCLPIPHSGGSLQVRHNGKCLNFDWSNPGIEPAQEPASIQWAAFYSDCEHEVLPVTSGHRITLTYNLYAINPDPDLSRPLPTDLSSPLLQHMESVLDNPHFLSKGGYLGFFTTHAYAHSSASFGLSTHLKGLDKVIWQGFQTLGCGVCMRPVLDYSKLTECWEVDKVPDSGPVVGKYLNIITVEGEPEYWKEHLESKITFGDVIWLNEKDMDEKHMEAQFAYTVYGNEAVSQFVYSWCAIIVGVPGYDEEQGGRMRLRKTFEERTRDWDDPLCTVRLLTKD